MTMPSEEAGVAGLAEIYEQPSEEMFVLSTRKKLQMAVASLVMTGISLVPFLSESSGMQSAHINSVDTAGHTHELTGVVLPEPSIEEAVMKYQQEQTQVVAYLASVKESEDEAAATAEARQEAAQQTVQPQQTQASTQAAPVQASGSDEEFLACTRAHESDSAGGYSAVSPDGLYYGAYQFLQSTWNNIAAQAGRGDLIGVQPNLAAPADQDALALFLYHESGNSPWGGRC